MARNGVERQKNFNFILKFYSFFLKTISTNYFTLHFFISSSVANYKNQSVAGACTIKLIML